MSKNLLLYFVDGSSIKIKGDFDQAAKAINKATGRNNFIFTDEENILMNVDKITYIKEVEDED